MNVDRGREFVGGSNRGVLATIGSDGRPQLSNMSFTLDEDGLIKMSTRGANVKVRNIRRDPRVSLVVQGETWRDYLVVDGTARVMDKDPLPVLRHIYERIRGGPHPNWQEFDEAMRNEARVVLEMSLDRIYPTARLQR